ncbi:DUF1501 domain-containing protein [Zavarzinella formosa]|uniref:DUF1501 domain-containing protein n=1 Tax=Zavarzinella formosa TaxID=360055 RepID=UPI000376E876|nr:DUF1501 domain-containing protein [Zavarzinella formosa]
MRVPVPSSSSQSPQRREFLRFGLSAFGALSLPDVLRLQASAGQPASGQKTAIILVWMRGGCSHLDTFDPKPDAPSEYRGPFKPIETKTPGLRMTELLPKLANISDRYTLLRSVAHTGGGHPAGSLQVLAGDTDPQDKVQPVYPDFMSVAHRLRYDPQKAIPNYIGVNPITRYDSFTIAGPTYLGGKYAPFSVLGDPNAPNFRVPNIGLATDEDRQRLHGRTDLFKNLDSMRRELDAAGSSGAFNQFQGQALNLLTSPEAARAFDLNLESPKLRDRYGRNAWGQQLLMARRLVEAGVEIITTELSGPLCGRVQNWDDHAVNHHVFDALKFRMPTVDQAVTALIEDVYERGLDKRVLVVLAGEFGRTPKISHVASSGGGVASGATGTVQPGRDHWPKANTMLFAGGGIRTGRVIGATDRFGENVTDRRVSPQDFLATLYQHLGIDYENTALPDQTGRPIHIVQNGKAIPELVAS